VKIPVTAVHARLLVLLVAFGAAMFTLGVLTAACGPANGSPNCPPGQWYADKPGTGRECVPGKTGAPVFVPATFAPSSPAGSAP
jgi:hypothetical protein